MKRFIYLLVSCTLLLVGCGSNSSTTNTDDYAVLGLTSASDDGIYHVMTIKREKWLYFYDFKTKKDVPFCSKVNCRHVDKECESYKIAHYIDDDTHLSFAPLYYQDKLYYFYENTQKGNTYFCESNIDGTNVKEIKKITELATLSVAMLYDNKLWYTENSLVDEKKEGESMLSTHYVSKVMDLSDNDINILQEDDNVLMLQRGGYKGNVYYSVYNQKDENNPSISLNQYDSSNYQIDTVIDNFEITNSFLMDNYIYEYSISENKINKIDVLTNTKEFVMDVTIPDGYEIFNSNAVHTDDAGLMTIQLNQNGQILGEIYIDLINKKILEEEGNVFFIKDNRVYLKQQDGTIYEK